MLHILSQTPTLAIASLPWLSARTGIWRGLYVLIVSRSVQLSETSDTYQPVADLLNRFDHTIHSGPDRYENPGMVGGEAVMTIYRLAVP